MTGPMASAIANVKQTPSKLLPDRAAVAPGGTTEPEEHKMTDPIVNSFDLDQTRAVVRDARRREANTVSAVRLAFNITRETARRLINAVDAADEHDRITADREASMPVRVGDVLAVGLDDDTCPVGKVVAVNDHAFRLDLYSPQLRTFTAGTEIVGWQQVEAFGPVLAGHGSGGVGMEPLTEFQTAWTEGDR